MAISKETKQVRYGNNIITVVRGDMPQEDWDDINSGVELSEKGMKGLVNSGAKLVEQKPDRSMLSKAEAQKQEVKPIPTPDTVVDRAAETLGTGVGKAVDYVSENAPRVIGQVVKMIPGAGAVVTEAEALGQMDAIAKGEKPSDNTLSNAARGVTSAVTNLGDATGAAVGFGKEVVGHASKNPNLVSEGKAQLQKNVADLSGQPETPPPPPAYPGPEPVEATPSTEQPVPSTPLPVKAQAPIAQAAPKPVLDMKKQDELTKAYEGLKGTSDAARGAIDSMQETRVANLKAEDALRTEAEQLALQRAQTQAEIMNRAQQKRAEMLDRQNQLTEMARKAAEDPIDPNRFWNNKDAGQKAAAVIAGALFGFTGQGMQWLQRLDSLVAQDMQAQSADKTRRIAGLERASEQAGNAAAMAMRMGADEAEAQNLERMAKLENVKSRIDMLARGTQNAELAAKGEMMKSQLDEKIMEAAQRNMQLRTAKDAQEANAYLERQKLGLMAARGSPGNQPLEPKMLEKLNNTREMVAKLRRMKELTADKGFFNRLKRMGLEKLDPEERAKAKAFESLSYEVKTLLAKSSLQAHEAKMLEDILGSRTGIISNTEAFDEMIGTSLGSMREQLRAAQGGRAGDVQDIENFISENSPRGSNIPASAIEEVQ